MPKLFLLIFVCWGLYLFVFVELNENVRKASTHGNTTHGWYSTYNTTEKFIAVAWIFGFPFTCFFVSILFSRPQQKRESEKIIEPNIDTMEKSTEMLKQKFRDAKK